jgi:hypothetical protein
LVVCSVCCVSFMDLQGARNMEVGVFTDSYLVDALEEHQAGEYATQMHAA